MTQVLVRGVAKRFFSSPFCVRPGRACAWAITFLFALSIFSGAAIAQSTPLAPPNKAEVSAVKTQTKNGAVAAPATTVTPAPVPPAPVAPVVTPQRPATPPVISWDGSRITIDAENSTLTDILLGIRGRTGASVELPPGTSKERVAVHLGPAPIREVLASLLYGTEFDYIIQASEDDPNGLRRVILTLRDKDDKDDNNDVLASDGPGSGHPRMMKGWAAPGKTDFQAAHEADVDSDSANAAEGAPATPDSNSAATESASNAPQSSGTEQTPSAGADAPAAAAASESPAALAPAEQSLSANRSAINSPVTSAISSGDSGSSASSISQMQNLQRMYEQRRQIQAQQNQSQNSQQPAP